MRCTHQVHIKTCETNNFMEIDGLILTAFMPDGISLELITSESTTVSAVYSDWSKPVAHVADGRPHEGVFTLLSLQPSSTPR